MSFVRYVQPTREERLAQRQERLHTLANPTVTPISRGTFEAANDGGAVLKRAYVRSPKLLALVRTLPCMETGLVGQTEPAHSNWSQHGKGRGIKADDNRVAALSSAVHRELDQGSTWTESERQRIWWRAHVRTVEALIAQGKWPKRVPIPQLEDFWK